MFANDVFFIHRRKKVTLRQMQEYLCFHNTQAKTTSVFHLDNNLFYDPFTFI